MDHHPRSQAAAPAPAPASCCSQPPTPTPAEIRRASTGAPFAHAHSDQLPPRMQPKLPWQRGFFYGPPLSWIYFAYVLLSVAFLMPFWTIKYLPPSNRPRKSWSIKMSVFVRAQHRLQLILKHCKTALICTDPSKEVDSSSLKCARFEWIPPVPKERLYGVAKYEDVEPVRIPAYVYPREAKCAREHLRDGAEEERIKDEVENGGGIGCPIKEKLVALFFHGGGYFVLSAHPSHSPAAISNALAEIPEISAVYALDYRLSSHTPFPAQLIDALSAYHHLVHTLHIPPHRIVLVGDSAGGNLALALARYLRDPPPQHTLSSLSLTPLRPPHALFLLSPWADAAWDVPIRPPGFKLQNEDIDYLNKDALAPLQRLALAGHRTGPDAIALWQSVWLSPGWKGLRYPLRIMTGNPSMSSVGLVPTLKDLAEEQRKRLDKAIKMGGGVGVRAEAEQEVLHEDRTRAKEGFFSSARRKSMKLVGGERVKIEDFAAPPSVSVKEEEYDEDEDLEWTKREVPATDLVPLFRGMPKNVFIGYGGAEALVEEIGRLRDRLSAAGSKVTMVEIEDAVHDCLILSWWDPAVKAKFWSDARSWWSETYKNSRELTKSGISTPTEVETGRVRVERLIRPTPSRLSSAWTVKTTNSDPARMV